MRPRGYEYKYQERYTTGEKWKRTERELNALGAEGWQVIAWSDRSFWLERPLPAAGKVI